MGYSLLESMSKVTLDIPPCCIQSIFLKVSQYGEEVGPSKFKAINEVKGQHMCWGDLKQTTGYDSMRQFGKFLRKTAKVFLRILVILLQR